MKKTIEHISVGALETNCWLYPTEDTPPAGGKQSCVIIDPGDDAELIISRLSEVNWNPRYILLTHGHFDHVAALPDLLKAYSQAASGSNNEEPPQIGIHRLDALYLGKDSYTVHRGSITAASGSSALADALLKPLPSVLLPEADILFDEGDLIGPFRVLHVPGHTPGGVGFYDEKAGILFSGDTLFRGTWGRTDLPGGSDQQIYQSLKRLLAMDKEIVVCPGHGEMTTIGHETGLLSSY